VDIADGVQVIVVIEDAEKPSGQVTWQVAAGAVRSSAGVGGDVKAGLLLRLDLG
jgi:hypothetical protein